MSLTTATPASATQTRPSPKPAVVRGSHVTPALTGVSETMLWALHNRASEALRPDGILVDPDCVRIHAAIDYDYTRKFGVPMGFLAARAVEIDRVLRRWIVRHPDGLVVSLGEGLETQGRRVDNGRLHWLSVDLPSAIQIREQFLPPTDRFRHLAVSALDPAWMEAVDDRAGVFIVAQGLLMYLEPDNVRQLLGRIADRFPHADLAFDVIPRWFSRLTLRGLHQTPHYRLPPMPWGINRDELLPTLRYWHPRLANMVFLDYRMPRGLPSLMAELVNRIPVVRHEVPSLVHITLGSIPQQRAMPVWRAPIGPKMSWGNLASTGRPIGGDGRAGPSNDWRMSR